MSAIIKSGSPSATSAQTLHSLTAYAANAEDPLRLEVEVLRERVADLSAELARTRQEAADTVQSACAAARNEGRQTGLAEAVRDDERRHALLRAGVDEAFRALKADMGSLERLAVIVARESLDRIFGDADARAEQVCAVIAAQLRVLDASVMLEVEVAADDFGADVSIPDLASRLGGKVRIQASTERTSGSCGIKLALGSMEVGPATQWTNLREVLTEAGEHPTS